MSSALVLFGCGSLTRDEILRALAILRYLKHSPRPLILALVSVCRPCTWGFGNFFKRSQRFPAVGARKCTPRAEAQHWQPRDGHALQFPVSRRLPRSAPFLLLNPFDRVFFAHRPQFLTNTYPGQRATDRSTREASVLLRQREDSMMVCLNRYS